MTLSGQSQAELIKAALVIAAAGVIVYYGKKFVDGFTSQVGSLADAPAKAFTAVGAAVGSAGAAVVEASKSGIEKAMDSQKTTAGNVPLNTMKILGAYTKQAVDSMTGKTYNMPFDTVQGQGY
jgi:chromosome segregation ATPase